MPLESAPPVKLNARTDGTSAGGGVTAGLRICMRSLMDLVVCKMASCSNCRFFVKSGGKFAKRSVAVFRARSAATLYVPAVPVIRSFNTVEAMYPPLCHNLPSEGVLHNGAIVSELL